VLVTTRATIVACVIALSRAAGADTATATDVVVPEPVTAPAPCDDPAVAPRLASLLHARRFADVHHAAVGLRVLCGPRESIDTWRVLDDIALLRLEDRAFALSDLDELSRGPRGELANLVLAWAYVTDRDHDAGRAVLARLPPPRAAAIAALGALDDADAFAAAARGIPGELRATAVGLADRYRDAREKRPALAGVLSALVPGAGQVYAGSWQAAAITFALNGLFIGATVELARDRSYITAAAAGTAASFFYVGGIINAVDLARRRNRVAMQPYADQLEGALVPELSGSFATP
jgi:hypothetical protein